MTAPPAAVSTLAVVASLPLRPSRYGAPSGPSCRCITVVATSSPAAPTNARRRAGAASRVGVRIVAAAPALAAAPDANTIGRVVRAPRHAGTDVFASSAPVYVASGRPNSAAPGLANRAGPGNSPVNVFAAAIPVVVPLTERTQEPTLIGDVTLNIRSMFRKRLGTPRSE